MKTKKGFSLVELAIVLVVIGILMGLAIKGKSLIDAANLKADINKISRIQMAVNTYFTKYDRLPGMTAAGGNISDQLVYNALVNEELLTYNDFVVSDGSYGYTIYWHFTGCNTNNAGFLVPQTISSSNRLCIYLNSTAAPGTITTTGAALTPAALGAYICAMETMVDDNNPRTGNGRFTTNETTGVGAANFRCNDQAVIDQGIVGYLYRVR